VDGPLHKAMPFRHAVNGSHFSYYHRNGRTGYH